MDKQNKTKNKENSYNRKVRDEFNKRYSYSGWSSKNKAANYILILLNFFLYVCKSDHKEET